MQNNIVDLYRKYLDIKSKGWIKTKRKGAGGIGYTFETLLNKEEENFPLPDFKGIEIKTMRKNSKSMLHLLNITPDGDYLFPIKRVLEKLGYPSKTNPKYKVFQMDVTTQEYTRVGANKKIKLHVNYEEEKLELIAETTSGKNLDINISWSFELLKEHVEFKLKYLAIVKAYNKIINGIEYFKYCEIKFYELKDFNKFLWLIELGIIKVTFNIDVFKNGRRIGQVHDHGTNFSINEAYLCNLYNNIEVDV